MAGEPIRLLSQLKGQGIGTMQIMAHRGYLYIGTLGPGGGTAIVDVQDVRHPRRVGHIAGQPGSFSPKVQVGDDLLIVNYEQRTTPASRVGLGLFDISDPVRPREIGWYSTGGRGVHRMWYTGGTTVYLSMIPDGFERRIFGLIDISDPAHPREISRWLPPDSEPPGLRYGLHHAIVHGNTAYAGWWDLGLVILRVDEPGHPQEIARIGGWAGDGGGHTHTVLPLPERDLLVVTDEAGDHAGEEHRKRIRVFEWKGTGQPRLLALCPIPAGDWGWGGTRFGPHNLHENRPGTWIDDRYVFATYFGAGLRVYDLNDPREPIEVASFTPEPHAAGPVPVNDLVVDAEGTIFLTDRRQGDLYVVEWTGQPGAQPGS